MSDDFAIILEAAVRRIAGTAVGDPELLLLLRQLAERFLQETEQKVETTGIDAAPSIPLPAVETPPVIFAPPVSPRHELLAPRIEVPIGWAKRFEVANVDLKLMEARCRLKAEGAHWAATRQRRLREGADYFTEIEPKDREIIEKAKALADCFLWMNHSSGPNPRDLELWEDVAGCFDANAAAIALLREVVGNLEEYGPCFEKALDLGAEAQSALRMAIDAIEGNADSDQVQLFLWLKETAQHHQLFIQRHMRIDDPADAKAWMEIQERIGKLDGGLQEIRKEKKRRQGRLQRCQYHVKQIREGKNLIYNWPKVVEIVEEMIADGIVPSNADLRELLLTVVEEMPDLGEIPPGFQRVLCEIDRFMATRLPPSGETVQEIAPQVKEAARLLAGKSIVMIGGERRLFTQESLRSAFRLKELIWIETREHQSIEGFEPYVARPEVILVLLAIRWSSHSYGETKDFCHRYGKPLVRLPGGYNPNQVAYQILEQCGERLARSVE
ncbi:MAG: hypothetical protein IT426_04830 [Pirellulales bacterium]|nr:hypothetical protein [Pirellulales bacterium]